MKSAVYIFTVIDLKTEFPTSILLSNTINEHMNSVYHLFLSVSSMFRWADHHQGDLPATQKCRTYCQYSHKSSHSWLQRFISHRCQLNSEESFRIPSMLLVCAVDFLPYIIKWQLPRSDLVSSLVPIIWHLSVFLLLYLKYYSGDMFRLSVESSSGPYIKSTDP
jgi:hypothetical protein